MCCIMTGIHSEKMHNQAISLLGEHHRGTCTDPGAQPTTHLDYGTAYLGHQPVQPVTVQNEIKSSTRESDAIKRQ